MTLRCKTGDLAFICGGQNFDPQLNYLKGKFVKVTVCDHYIFGALWHTEELIVHNNLVIRVADEHLMPIKNPGDDAEDEMVTIMKNKQLENV